RNRRATITMFFRFQPEGMNVRMSGGQPSYSHVVTVSGTGKIVYTAGQRWPVISTAIASARETCAPQMEQTFKKLDQCLKAAGASWADVVKTNTLRSPPPLRAAQFSPHVR